MATSTEEIQGIQQEFGSLKIDTGAAKSNDGTSGSQTSEIVTTPTDAAAAGGVQVNLLEQGTYTSVQEKAGKQQKALDDLFPADSLTTTAIDGAVKLRMSETGGCSLKPITLITLFKEVVNKVPDRIALGVKRNGEWIKWTYNQYNKDVQKATKSLIAVGLESYHGVGILGFNSPEWFITYLASIHAGGKATGIYTTNSPEACQFVLEDSQSNVIVVENNDQLQKILQIWHCLPHLKAIVQYTGELKEKKENVYTWNKFLELGKDVTESQLEERLQIQAPNTCCSLIYTSGTTGNPKAVMLSHDNATWTSYQVRLTTRFKYAEEIIVSFLPLSHIAGQLMDIIGALQNAFSIYFAQPDALKGTLVETLKEVRPTGFMGVPRLWEKMQARIKEGGKQNGFMKQMIARWAKDLGLRGSYSKMKKEGVPYGWSIANMLVFKKVKGLLGLDRCWVFGSGAAPITKDTLEFFASLDIRIDNIYGMSECAGPHTFNSDEVCKLMSAGKEFDGGETRFDDKDEDGNGEVCMSPAMGKPTISEFYQVQLKPGWTTTGHDQWDRSQSIALVLSNIVPICYWGRHIMMGYLNQPEKTKEAIGPDGWLHSGDVGKKDEDGFLYITGRIKEIIVTAGGENIAPIPIEECVREELPVVSNCMLIGDKRKFLSMLITLKTEVNLDTMEPQPTLLSEAVQWCKTVGATCTTVKEAREDPNVIKAIQAGIDRANKKAVSRAAKIQKWCILPKDFSLPGGELGPTMKLKRPVVVKMYDETISTFYEE